MDLAQMLKASGGQELPQENPLSSSPGGEAAGFADSLMQAISSVSDKDRLAAERMEAVEKGSSDDLVGAMLSSQDASLSFSMLMQVRNKVVGAVDELIKLQL
jgi:flagellar hook-basal body complex protein FliE